MGVTRNFLRNLTRRLALKVPYFWFSLEHIVVLKVLNSSLSLTEHLVH